MIDLDESLLISRGKKRLCFQHPHDQNLCIKTPLDSFNAEAILQRELATYEHVKKTLSAFITPYDGIVQTNYGVGIVMGIVRDDAGNISRDIFSYAQDDDMMKIILEQLAEFLFLCLRQNLFFYDLNGRNFLLQINNGKPQLKYIDLKSYRRAYSFLQSDNLFPILGRMKMRRRMKRLFKIFNASMA